MKMSGKSYARRLQTQVGIARYERLRKAILETSRVPIVTERTSSLPQMSREDINAIRALILLNEEATNA